MMDNFLSDRWERLSDRWPQFDPGEVDSPPESLMISAAAIAAGVATRRGLKSAWRKWRNTDPPINPAADEVTWTDALIWAAAVGVAVGVARVLTRRTATSAVRRCC